MKPSIWWVVIGAAALLGWTVLRREIASNAVLKERIRARELTIAALARQAHTVDTAYVTDTLTLTRWRTSYTARRDTLRLTDTVAVKQFVAVADSTIHACSVALETCEHRVAVRDSIIASHEALERDLKRQAHGFTFLGIPLGCTAGYGLRSRGSDLVCGVALIR